MILVKSCSLSSLATGPKIRVPLGVLSSLIITAAFSSNLTKSIWRIHIWGQVYMLTQDVVIEWVVYI